MTLCLLLLAAGCSGGTFATTPAPAIGKKGIGAINDAHATAELASANIAWYYNWRSSQTEATLPTINPVAAPAGVQFVPMIWGAANATPGELADAQATGSGILLGFNEPDLASQANMTVAQALALWPSLMATGMRLGSPAVSSNQEVSTTGWLAQFMAGAAQAGYRVDFICIHAYQSSFDPAVATQNLVAEVNAVYALYHLPIWVTEFAEVDWSGPGTPSAATQATFAASASTALQGLASVERFAWYTNTPDGTGYTYNLYDQVGAATAVGNAYSALPATAALKR